MKIEVIECGRHHSPMRRRETHEDFQCVVPDCRNTLTDQELHRAIQDRPNLRRAVVSEFYDLPGGRID